LARNPKKLEVAKMSWANKLHLLAYDLSGLRAETRRRVIDAGIMDLPALPERWATAQGLEPQVGVCYIGNFYLFKLVKPALSTAPLLLLQAALLLCRARNGTACSVCDEG